MSMRADRTFPTLNALRAIGALMVVGTHAAFNTGQITRGWSGAVLSRLDFGVTLFFILSGFLLSRPIMLARARGTQAPAVGHYLWKRALRILPLYWVVVLVAMFFDPANSKITTANWIRHLTFTQLYAPKVLASSLTQMWSLATEVAFYILMPLIVAFLLGRKDAGLHLPTVIKRSTALGVAGLTWQAITATIPGREGHFAQWLPGFLPWFLVGIVFAAVSAHITVTGEDHLFERLAHDLTGCWIVATATFAIACSPIAGPRLLLVPGAWEAGLKALLYTVAGAFFVLPLVFGPEREGRVRRALSGTIPFWFGEISYGIFAIHMFVLNMVFRATKIDIFTGHYLYILFLTLVVTTVVAALSFHLMEKPIMRWKNATWVVGAREETAPKTAKVN